MKTPQITDFSLQSWFLLGFGLYYNANAIDSLVSYTPRSLLSVHLNFFQGQDNTNHWLQIYPVYVKELH